MKVSGTRGMHDFIREKNIGENLLFYSFIISVNRKTQKQNVN